MRRKTRGAWTARRIYTLPFPRAGDQYHQYDDGIVTTSRGTYVAGPAAGTSPQLQDVPDRQRTQKPLFLLCSATRGMSLGSCIVTRNGVTGHRAGDLGVVGVHGQRIRDSRQCTHQSMIATRCVKMVLLRLEGHLLPEQKAEVGLVGPGDIPSEGQVHMADACRIVFQTEHTRCQVLGKCSGERETIPSNAGRRRYLLTSSDLAVSALEQALTVHSRARIS